ncbi:MAG: YicC family protein [Planctomycetes bacterium]|nr:YicC family protein [Planctomycetota bacterium]
MTSLRSMTGFGAGRADGPGGDAVEAELRCVNHKHFRLTSRVPDVLLSASRGVEALLKEELKRGSATLNLRYSWGSSSGARYELDEATLLRFMGQLEKVASELGQGPPNVAQAALLPGVVSPSEGPDGATLTPVVEEAVRKALAELVRMREQEGAALARDLDQALSAIEVEVQAIEARRGPASKEQAARLLERVTQLLEGRQVAAGDLARETALLAEKADVAEELVRVRSHLEQFREALESGALVGRRLEFLAQELHREANTMASKNADTQLLQHVLELRIWVDRVREQAANVE